MTLEYYRCGDGQNVRTLTCPFCDAKLGKDRSLAVHLMKCDEVS